MKQQADQHRSERSFEVGDWVFLRLQPYKQMSLKQAKKDNELIHIDDTFCVATQNMKPKPPNTNDGKRYIYYDSMCNDVLANAAWIDYGE
jgi:hypothetical protein